MSGFDNRSDLPPPHYDWSQQDFDSKTATAAERSLHQSFAPISGPSCSVNEDDFETWSDEKFAAAARAFEARQAKRRMQGTPQPAASGSGPGPASNRASSSAPQYDVSGPQTYQLDRSQTPRPSDYAHPYYSASPPTSAPPSVPASAPRTVPSQPPVPPYMQGPPPSNAVPNEDEPIATGGGGLQRAVSLFRTPSISRNDHGEQLPAFTDVALPEEMVPQDMAHTGPRSPPPTVPQSPPPPPHTFSAPSNPPPPRHDVPAQTGPTFLSPTAPQSPPPPHTFSAPSSPSPALHNVQPPPPPLNVSRPRPISHTSAPASPIYSDAPPAFVPSSNHYPIPEKINPPSHLQLGNTRGMTSPMSVYASAKRTAYASPTINFDLETAYGRTESPGLPKENTGSFYSSAVSSTMSGRQLAKPGGARPRSTLPPPPEPSPWTTGMGGQPGTCGGHNQTSSYYPQYQQPHQPGGFYMQPPGQQPHYGQNQPPQQGTHWNNQYPNYGLTTPPPGGHGQHAGWGGPPPAAPWPGNGGHYRP